MVERVAVSGGIPTFKLQPADDLHLPCILKMLREANLPIEGVEENLSQFLVGTTLPRVVACVGLEVYGRDALLRSLVVASSLRGRGYGEMMVEGALRDAAEREVERVYLLAPGTERFFGRFGFQAVPRREAPAAIAGSTEFRADACANATLMCLTPVVPPPIRRG